MSSKGLSFCLFRLILLGVYFILTTSAINNVFTPTDALLSNLIIYAKGQLELPSEDTDIEEQRYLHWQWIINLSRQARITQLKKILPAGTHIELTRSAAAEEYVWKEETRVDGTQFEFGKKPFRRQETKDWDAIKDLAKEGRLDEIDSSVFVCNYNSLKRIAKDYHQPQPMHREVFCYWGATETGKSHRAWKEAGWDAYPKISTTKFWDGYRGQENCVVEEFEGDIALVHILRWTDEYPVTIEEKGGAICYKSKRIWFTSNTHPRDWYPNAPKEKIKALLRRFDKIIEFKDPFGLIAKKNRKNKRRRIDCTEETELLLKEELVEEDPADEDYVDNLSEPENLCLDDILEEFQETQPAEQWEEWVNKDAGPSKFNGKW